ncbi:MULTISPECIES: response regulator transcription factor [Pseudomonadati]|jgi:DNA-binding response OmpR family regulator|uniref:Response regulator transcription factor n=1 Tax=Shewanella aestuarii TaxID=1028752 RepID=A0ABT0KYK8_9GAMM|nr:response regulator transcription factor [Shewanella aestuarii]MCL1116507.1 response regulator transcription factor [Shewanella aestuarii]GGN71830.1 DNA-binding response regulator [Shewanella aestuarii]
MNHSAKHNGHTSPQHILLVEDEQDLAKLILLNLSALNYQVCHATTLKQAMKIIEHKKLDLILMDRMLPDGDGLMLCQQLRQAQKEVPIMLLTAKDSEADIVLGLEAGADDYLVKPFSVLELRARVKAHLRRGQVQHELQQQLDFNGVSINASTREVLAFNNALALTAREFDLLLFLAQHPQQVFSRLQLLEAVWGYNYSGYEHTVNSHINRLRNKLSRCSEHDLVKTVWGVGYKFSPPEAHAH